VNLTALISKGFLEGYYYKPRIDMELLEKPQRGLIVLSAACRSLVAAPLLKTTARRRSKQRRNSAKFFGDRFYIEIMRHGCPKKTSSTAA